MQGEDAGLDKFAAARRAMVEEQVRKRGIASTRVLEAMLSVPRHEFVPAEFPADAYADKPLPIVEGQTISQPFMVGAMTQPRELADPCRARGIATGSSSHAAAPSPSPLAG